MGSESIAHEAEGRMGYWLWGHEGERKNCFSTDPTSWSKISRIKKFSLLKLALILFCHQKARAFRYYWVGYNK